MHGDAIKPVKRLLRRLGIKIAGKGGRKLGGKLVPIAGLVDAGVDLCTIHNCLNACQDGEYTMDETTFISLYVDRDGNLTLFYRFTDWLWH